MFRWTAVILLGTTPVFAGFPEEIAFLSKPSPDQAATRAAWERLSSAGPEALLPILQAWPANDPVAIYWLRTAADDIASHHADQLPVDSLLSFAGDRKWAGKARRVAFAAIERKNPGTLKKMLPKLLIDPEFGTEAVADRILASENAKDPAETKRILSIAYEAATEVEQVQAIAKKLTVLGEQPKTLAKLGIISDWLIIGPFNVSPSEGLKKSFPPESAFDRTAEFEGKAGKLRWIEAKADADGKTDLSKYSIAYTNGSVAYARINVKLAAETKGEIRLAATDNVSAFVNGKEAVRIASDFRSQYRTDRHRAKIELNAGENTILIKLIKAPAEESGRPTAPPKWDFQVRLVGIDGHGLSFVTNSGEKK